MTRSITVLGIRLYMGSLRKLLAALKGALDRTRVPVLVSATSVHGVVEANMNDAFRHTLDAFAYHVPDGYPLVRWGRWRNGTKAFHQLRGVAFMHKLSASKWGQSRNHFLCGATPPTLSALQAVLKHKWQVKGTIKTYSPPFIALTKYDYPAIAARMKKAQAQIIWIGLGTPKQEVFALRLAEAMNNHPCIICTVGAAFSIHAGKQHQAPLWIRQIGLEWSFRLVQNPKRLFRRYIRIIPLFFYLCIKDLFTQKKEA